MTSIDKRTLRSRFARGAVLATAGLLLAACGPFGSGHGSSSHADGGGTTAPVAASPTAAPPYNVVPLLHPAKKYLGVSLPKVPEKMAGLTTYADEIGKKPNLVEYYQEWGGAFNASGVRDIYKAGGLAYMAWEPYQTTLAKIAAGDSDAYLKTFAAAVKKLNLPVAISFGHEMNGNWYPWGTQAATPAQFVAAWRHIHDLFTQAGVGNVIWVWSPNIVNPVPQVKLSSYYPGDQYVDWNGMIGYYALTGAHTFSTLFGPTMKQVQKFSTRPFLISETASQPGARREADISDLFAGVASHSDVIGFIWFDVPKRADWRIENTPDALAEYKRLAASPTFGFPIDQP